MSIGNKLAAVFLLIMAWIGIYMALFHGIGEQGRTSGAAAAAKKSWDLHSACGITLQAPGSFSPFEHNFGEAAKLMESGESRRCMFPDFLEIVTRVTFRQGAQINLDNTVKGHLASLSAMHGVTVQSTATKRDSVSGRLARRVDATLTQGSGWFNKHSILMSALWIMDERTMYCVQVDAENADTQVLADMEKVMKSVKIGR